MDIKQNVCSEIVSKGLCVGCGTCAGLCPRSCLTMAFNKHGEYNPVEEDGCKRCGICLNTCPFSDLNRSEDELGRNLFGQIDEINHRLDCGYYLDSFVGYSSMYRGKAASGGLATWTLETLLKRGFVTK